MNMIYPKCKHEAYKENCLICMYEFKIFARPEIKLHGLKKTITKYKKAGYFL